MTSLAPSKKNIMPGMKFIVGISTGSGWTWAYTNAETPEGAIKLAEGRTWGTAMSIFQIFSFGIEQLDMPKKGQ